ncbi:THUMP domain-containing proteins protein [Dioscorea alata]|uniref:THUMP domain-containing proteins protein n=1 Tax=Dioscorea alata TaxID=55571 RepID=A0ACB7WU35_DIOAL|nr:THUMP domain-containing proteins protein [Dioscorea alata]
MEGGKEELGLGHEERPQSLTPWEQHSKVILIPRFDYKASSSLLERSHSGFLITCPIKREKSATKEAITILEEYAGSMFGKNLDESVLLKRRKVCLIEEQEGYDKCVESIETDNGLKPCRKVTKEASITSSEIDDSAKASPSLSLVKLTRSGLLLLTFLSDNVHQTVDTLSCIFHSLGSGKLKAPIWCNRIFPIQETCILTEENLNAVVSKLFKEYLSNKQVTPETSIKFAVGYNRRGIDETTTKGRKSTDEGSQGLGLLDRDKCFEVVARAIKAIANNASVDLKSPEVAVLVELLPVSGVLQGSSVAGVSVLPHNLLTTKPRLCIKSLVSDSKAAKRKES